MEGFLQGPQSGSPGIATRTALTRVFPCLKATYGPCSCGPDGKLLDNFIPLTITKRILVFVLSRIYSQLLPKHFSALSSLFTYAHWCLPHLTPKYLQRTILSFLSPLFLRLNVSVVTCVSVWVSSTLPLPERPLGLLSECAAIISCPSSLPRAGAWLGCNSCAAPRARAARNELQELGQRGG